MIPAEDTYVQIIGDESRLWATKRVEWVAPEDAEFLAWLENPPQPPQTVIYLESEAAIDEMLQGVGLGHLGPNPPMISAGITEDTVTRAEFEALEARVVALEEARWKQ